MKFLILDTDYPEFLLLAGKGKTDKEITEVLSVGHATVERTRKKFVEGGLAFALHEHPRPGARESWGGDKLRLVFIIRSRKC